MPKLIPGKCSPFFVRVERKGFPFVLLWGLHVAFPLLERVVPRSQKDGVSGKKNAWGGVGWTGRKKGKKDAQKKVGIITVM